MAVILPHGVLFRSGGAEERIRHKLLEDGNIDTIIGLPANLFIPQVFPYVFLFSKVQKPTTSSSSMPLNILRRASGKTDYLVSTLKKIVDTYQFRTEEERYSRCVGMDEISAANGYNLNIARYISTAIPEKGN